MQPRRKLARLALTLQGERSRKLAASAHTALLLPPHAAVLIAPLQGLSASNWPRPAPKAALRGGAGCLKLPQPMAPGKRILLRLPAQPRQRTREYATAAARASAHLTFLQFAVSESAAWRAGRSSRRRSCISRTAHDLR